MCCLPCLLCDSVARAWWPRRWLWGTIEMLYFSVVMMVSWLYVFMTIPRQMVPWNKNHSIKEASVSGPLWACSFAQSCPTLCDPMNYKPTRLLCPWDSPGKNTGLCCHALLQEIINNKNDVNLSYARYSWKSFSIVLPSNLPCLFPHHQHQLMTLLLVSIRKQEQ